MTIGEALAESKALLSGAGIENPALDADLLLAHALGVNRSALVAARRDSDALNPEALERFRAFIERRRSGECVAYILEKKEFFGLEFFVNKNVLVPRPDTECLVEAALSRLAGKKTPNLRALDLCAGSGAIAIALKSQRPDLEAWATDISQGALEVAKINAACLLPLGAVHFRLGDLFQALSAGDARAFDLITANAPYVPAGEIPGLSAEVRGEPILALDGGADGLDIIRKIVAQAPRFLLPGGSLMLEADPRQMPAIALMLESAGLEPGGAIKDLSGRDRALEAFQKGD